MTQVQYVSVDMRSEQRRRVESLVDRARYLTHEDRVLVEQVYREGMSMTRLAHIARRPPREMQRRFGRILQRMNSKLFKFVIRHLSLLSPPQRHIARLVILQGHSQRKAADLGDTTLHQVRQLLAQVKALANV